MIFNYYYNKITRTTTLKNHLNASLVLSTMNEFPNLFVFIRGVANLLLLLSSYEIETEGGRQEAGNLTTWIINNIFKQMFC